MILTEELLRRAAVQAEINLLAQIPQENEIKHTFSKRYERKMRRLIRSQRRPPAVNTAIRVTKRTVLVLAAAVTLMLATVLGVGAWRARFFEMLQEVFEKYTEIRFEITDGGARAVSEFEIWIPAYIPDGYNLTASIEHPEIGFIMYEYSDAYNHFIVYCQNLPDAGVVQYNTENTGVIDVKVGENAGHYLATDGRDVVFWTNDSYFFDITTSLGEKETLRIAKSVTKKKS